MSNEHVTTLAKILDDKYPAAREALTEAREKLETKLSEAEKFLGNRKQPSSKRNSMNAASVAAAKRKEEAVRKGSVKNNDIKAKIDNVLDDLDAISKLVKPDAEMLLNDISQLTAQRDSLSDSVVNLTSALDETVDQADQLVERDDLADDLMEIRKACDVFFQACIDTYNNEKQNSFDAFKKDISDASVQVRTLAKNPNTGQDKINLINGLGDKFTKKFNTINTQYSQADEITECLADYNRFQTLVTDTVKREHDNIKAAGERRQVGMHNQIDDYIRERERLYQLKFVDQATRTEFEEIVEGLTAFKDNYVIITKEDILRQAKTFETHIGWNLPGLFDRMLLVLEPKEAEENQRPALNRIAADLYRDLQAMRNHASELRRDKKHPKNVMHGLIALDVCDEIRRESDLFFSDPANLADERTVSDYKTRVKNILLSKEEIMNQHSAKWKVYVGNFLACLGSLSVGAFILLARKISSMSDKKFDAKKDSILFFGKTHRARDVDTVLKDVERVRVVKAT